MNSEACANCLVHGWKQLEDETAMMQCKNCKVIRYCSKECQLEHWIKVHRHHCQYFADPAKTVPWQHKEQDCLICQQAAAVGEYSLAQVENPYYECIHGKFKELHPDLYHPHPFPVTGDSGDIREQAIIVLWQLVNKFKLIHPNVARICEDEFLDVEDVLLLKRLDIWFKRKIYPQPLAVFSRFSIDAMLSSIEMKMDTSDMDDPFKLWKIIMLVALIEQEVTKSNLSQFFKDPLCNLLHNVQKLVSHSMNNHTKFLTLANDVLVALAVKVIPYQEVLKIICGGGLEQKCSSCSQEVFISDENISNEQSDLPSVFFSRLLLGKFICEAEECSNHADIMAIGHLRFLIVLAEMWVERKDNICDFCFQRTPVKLVGSARPDIHRCSYCRKTMYCSMDCLHQDWQVHLKVCHKDRDGRKKKPGGSARRKVAREVLEKMEKATEEEKEFEDVLKILEKETEN